MEYLIIILLIIIILLSLYLFFVNKELERITSCLKEVKNDDSNQLINKELSSKVIGNLLKEINNLLKTNREEKIEYEKKNKALRKMITNISHDLRTPLTSALGHLDLISNSNLSIEEKEHSLKVVEERLHHLEDLINSFFELSCIVSSNKEIVLEPTNVIAILESCIAYYYDDYKNANRTIIFYNKIKKYNIQTNKEMLKRIIDNLIANAYKHSESNLTIKVEEKGALTIRFKNELNFKDLDINHIFDEFYAVDISRTKGNTGLGLAIAKEFTQKLNGTIKAEKKNNNLEIILNFKN